MNASHELTITEPIANVYVQRLEDGELSPTYLKREGIYPKGASSTYVCACGQDFGPDRAAARDHLVASGAD